MKMRYVLLGTILLSSLLLAASPAQAAERITKEEVIAAQTAWSEAIVAIGHAYATKGDYEKVARETVENLYAYDLSPVLFAPTKAMKMQFRTTKEEALSYFVKGIVSEDNGFALQPWSNVRFEDQHMVLHDCDAIAQGNYYFTDAETNKEVKVEYTFGYIKDDKGKLRIFLHHSSLPFMGK